MPVLTIPQGLFISVLLVVAAALILPGCGLPGVEYGHSPLWEGQQRWAH